MTSLEIMLSLTMAHMFDYNSTKLHFVGSQKLLNNVYLTSGAAVFH
jgi:hypothetical protein